MCPSPDPGSSPRARGGGGSRVRRRAPARDAPDRSTCRCRPEPPHETRLRGWLLRSIDRAGALPLRGGGEGIYRRQRLLARTGARGSGRPARIIGRPPASSGLAAGNI
ncbi:hypothetical protein PVAP13_9KG026157 [Panicum virgatum]|uniref:Uncharacterized protein n=1 Tax=Panicum virgatum TaxID=38727 RepID=A0A8T0NAV3_PANVG|nr:hypothetical protein PVAP13_9KG026157 [Panicum virgatum]